ASDAKALDELRKPKF
nr:II-55=respiratory proteins {N-terminal} [Chlamydomonas reinhardtii=green alga, membranes, imported proteins, Peptide Mitochondrial Partial, 15 aa] [Chlamydomonas reinhardtii]